MASDSVVGRPKSPPARREGRKRKGRPRLESPSLLLWFLTGDLVLLLVMLLAVQVEPQALWWIHCGALCLVTFGLFAIDKALARSGRRRVSEINLFVLAALGGAAGALFGMLAFRHKTRTGLFRYGVPILLLVHLVLTAIIFTPSEGAAG